MAKCFHLLIIAAVTVTVVGVKQCRLVSPSPADVIPVFQNHFRYEGFSGGFLNVSFLLTGLDKDAGDDSQLYMTTHVSHIPEVDPNTTKTWNGRTEVIVSTILNLPKTDTNNVRYIEWSRHILLRADWWCHLDIMIRPSSVGKLNASLTLHNDDETSSKVLFEFRTEAFNYPNPVRLEPVLTCAEGHSIGLLRVGETDVYTANRSEFREAYSCNYSFYNRRQTLTKRLTLPRDIQLPATPTQGAPTPAANRQPDSFPTTIILAIAVPLGFVIILLLSIVIRLFIERKKLRHEVCITTNQTDERPQDYATVQATNVPSLYCSSSYPNTTRSSQPANNVPRGMSNGLRQPPRAVPTGPSEVSEDTNYTDGVGIDPYLRPAFDRADDVEQSDDGFGVHLPNGIALAEVQAPHSEPGSMMPSSNHYETVEPQPLNDHADDESDIEVSMATIDSPQFLDETRDSEAVADTLL